MKEALKFINHGVSNRMFDASLSNVHFCNDCIQSFNGVITMSHRFDGIGKFSVSSTKLIKAIAMCDYAPEVRFTDKNVILKKGKFRAMLPYSKDHVRALRDVSLHSRPLTETFLPMLSKLFPYISADASREWSQSVLIRDGFAYVTNNIVALRVPTTLPNCVLPIALCHVLIKVKTHPKILALSKRAIRIDYEKGQWIECRTLEGEWPAVETFFKKRKRVKPLKKKTKEALQKAITMTSEDFISVKDGVLTTDLCTIKDVKICDCSFSSSNMAKVMETFTHITFHHKIIKLAGDGIQGVMACKI